MHATRLVALAALTLAMSTRVHSQASPAPTSGAPRLQVELTAGPSLPLGAFAQEGPGPWLSARSFASGRDEIFVRHDETGLARRGLGLGLGARYWFTPALAAGIEVAHTRYAVETAALMRWVRQTPAQPGYSRVFRHSAYRVMWYGTDARVRFATIRGLALSASVGGGLARTEYPDWDFVLIEDQQGFEYYYGVWDPNVDLENYSNSTAYAGGEYVTGGYAMGALHAGYDTERFGIGLTARLRHARFSYDVFPSAYPGNSSPPKFYQDQLRVTTLDVGASVSYLLLKPQASRPRADAKARASKR